MKKFFTQGIISLFLCITTFFVLNACSGSNEGTKLQTEVVEIPDDPDKEVPFHNLFNLEPGQQTTLSSYAGSVDPVGTTIVDDFDGDGIINEEETTSNIWVADYPKIETHVEPPVTMRIEILHSSAQSSETLTSDIATDDMENTIDKSTEAIHRYELYRRTVQYQNTHITTDPTSASANAAISMGLFSVGGSTSGDLTKIISSTWTGNQIKWTNAPFKNSLKQRGKSLKTNEASQKACYLRKDLRAKTKEGFEIKPDAGFIRAALYISNESVNMPVKLSNITCSMMFETADGELVSVQRFLLKNEDSTPFSISLYGGDTFGPYFIELNNLNTSEIENAIAKGYNPRIFLVDYEMKHVEDSNYRQALSANFSGDNLKIIEENAKGRTAGIKIIGPGLRKFFRTVAFDTNGSESRTDAAGMTRVTPGVSLEKAITRISYSGINVEFADYVFDLSGMDPPPVFEGYSKPLLHVRGIKSIEGIETNLPVAQVIEGKKGTTYIIKPTSEMTEDEIKSFKLWAVFSDGRYYEHSAEDIEINGSSKEFVYTDLDGNEQRAPKLIGIKSMIWPGDHYDLAYMDMKEFLDFSGLFGSNPLETEEELHFNTRWNTGQLTDNYFYPSVKSTYLGEVILGDEVELKITLDDNNYLNPSFGTPEVTDRGQLYSDFSYDPFTGNKMRISEAIDFEISFALDQNYEDWMNLFPERSPYAADYYQVYKDDPEMITYYWNMMEQEFTVKLKIPSSLPGIDESGKVGLYIRTALNNAYRESIWPYHYTEVKKFRGSVDSESLTGSTTLLVRPESGIPESGDTLQIAHAGSSESYTIDTVTTVNSTYRLTLSTPLSRDYADGDLLSIELAAPLSEPEVVLAVDNDFFSDWNTEWNSKWSEGWDQNWEWIEGIMPLMESNMYSEYTPAKNLGFNVDYMIGNWLGNNNTSNPYWNNWSDASFKEDYLDKNLSKFLSTDSGKQLSLIKPWNLYDDFLISTSNPNYQSYPQITFFQDKAFIVWESEDNKTDYDIRGRIYDFATNSFTSDDFLISTTNNDDQTNPSISCSENQVFITWHSDDNGTDDDIRGRIYDMSTNSFTSDDFLISTTNNSTQGYPAISCSENQAFITWKSNDNGKDGDIRGRIYDMSTNSFTSSDFLISTTNNLYQDYPSISCSENQAFITWGSNDTGTGYDIRGRIYDLSTNSFTSDDFLISTTNNRTQCYPSISCSENQVFITWHSNDNGTDDDIRGRIYDLSTNSFTSDDFLISTTNNSTQGYPSISCSENQAFIIWQSYDNGKDYDIRGRIYDVATNSFTSDDFLISTINNSTQGYPAISISNNKAFIIWQSSDITADYYNIRGRILSFLDFQRSDLPHGLSNFFTAPLIERNYTVTTKIMK